MQVLSDSNLLDQLKNEENASYALLYKFYYRTLEAHVVRNSGSVEDAEDVFQEAILVLLQQVRKADFVLTASLKTYLFAIARNLWLKRLRDKKYRLPDLPDQSDELTPFEGCDEPTLEEKLNGWLTNITKNCQRILKALFYFEEPMESLMQKMGWKNKHTAANQQYKCIQQVKKEKDKMN